MTFRTENDFGDLIPFRHLMRVMSRQKDKKTKKKKKKKRVPYSDVRPALHSCDVLVFLLIDIGTFYYMKDEFDIKETGSTFCRPGSSWTKHLAAINHFTHHRPPAVCIFKCVFLCKSDSDYTNQSFSSSTELNPRFWI